MQLLHCKRCHRWNAGEGKEVGDREGKKEEEEGQQGKEKKLMQGERRTESVFYNRSYFVSRDWGFVEQRGSS